MQLNWGKVVKIFIIISNIMFGVALNASELNVPNGFRALFNGKDLEGWYGFDPHRILRVPEKQREAERAHYRETFSEHWRVEAGELVNDGTGPYAVSRDSYGDIELLIEYKTIAKADSGIYLRGCPQVQIWDSTDKDGHKLITFGSGGLFNNSEGTAGQVPLVNADRPFGEWNKFRIIQVGSRTTVYLNDKLVVNDAIMENFWDKTRETPIPSRGPILLQTHGGEIRWRNIFVREIRAEEANKRLRRDDDSDGFMPLFNGVNFDGWGGAIDSYEVREGALICKKGKKGVLHTLDTYNDYVVRFDFKLP